MHGANTQHLEAELQQGGFVFLDAPHVRAWLEAEGSLVDWAKFSASWNDLHLDTFMADGGRYRKRRHGVFAAIGNDMITRQPHQAHWQSREYNRLNGGHERWFEPLTEATANSPSLGTVLQGFRRICSDLAPEVVAWHIEVHQFRIEASREGAGQPTPEGMHRDGVDFVLVLMIDRHNIREGTTSIHALDGNELGRFTLAKPFDAAIVEDWRVLHGVTPVEPVDPALPSSRDVLVVTFRRLDDAPARRS
ncbi:MAG TPA: 2OG-Fe dioxygenase family protein [Chiayiivirga sp.]|nr:2OG-Fe dioxygenase family protein [Chiayiivirga sp.]